jgi:hypothetical protein
MNEHFVANIDVVVGYVAYNDSLSYYRMPLYFEADMVCLSIAKNETANLEEALYGQKKFTLR